MDGYTKLFGSILTSSIWVEDWATRLVWITMLALKNSRNIVEGAVPGIAHVARVPLKECRAAIIKLESPDPDSRNQDHQGRRIEKVDGGWLILNGERFKEKMSEEDRKKYRRNWMRSYREKTRTEPPKGPHGQTMAEAEFIKSVYHGE